MEVIRTLPDAGADETYIGGERKNMSKERRKELFSTWEKTKIQYEELKKAGRLSEIEERAANVAEGIFKTPYKTLKEYRKSPNQAV